MPNCDGFQATELIRKHEAKKSLDPTPIIAMTAYSMPEDQAKCISKGVYASACSYRSLRKQTQTHTHTHAHSQREREKYKNTSTETHTRTHMHTCTHAGMSDYVSKPFTRERLRDIVLHWIESRAADPASQGEAQQSPHSPQPRRSPRLQRRSLQSGEEMGRATGCCSGQGMEGAERPRSLSASSSSLLPLVSLSTSQGGENAVQKRAAGVVEQPAHASILETSLCGPGHSRSGVKRGAYLDSDPESVLLIAPEEMSGGGGGREQRMRRRHGGHRASKHGPSAGDGAEDEEDDDNDDDDDDDGGDVADAENTRVAGSSGQRVQSVFQPPPPPPPQVVTTSTNSSGGNGGFALAGIIDFSLPAGLPNANAATGGATYNNDNDSSSSSSNGLRQGHASAAVATAFETPQRSSNQQTPSSPLERPRSSSKASSSSSSSSGHVLPSFEEDDSNEESLV